MSIPSFVKDPPSFDDIMTDMGVYTPHIVVRVTVEPGTTRCEGYPTRDFAYFGGSISDITNYWCFADVRVNDYIVGAGPPALTVGTVTSFYNTYTLKQKPSSRSPTWLPLSANSSPYRYEDGTVTATRTGQRPKRSSTLWGSPSTSSGFQPPYQDPPGLSPHSRRAGYQLSFRGSPTAVQVSSTVSEFR